MELKISKNHNTVLRNEITVVAYDDLNIITDSGNKIPIINNMLVKMKCNVKFNRNKCCQDIETKYQDLSTIYDEEHDTNNISTRFRYERLSIDKVNLPIMLVLRKM